MQLTYAFKVCSRSSLRSLTHSLVLLTNISYNLLLKYFSAASVHIHTLTQRERELERCIALRMVRYLYENANIRLRRDGFACLRYTHAYSLMQQLIKHTATSLFASFSFPSEKVIRRNGS